MRVERVLTNLSCNQNCGYCTSRSASDDRAFIHPEAVRRRITAAAATEELVLTGGEPTLRKDLPALIASARAAGTRQVVLETNGTLIDATMAGALQAAGLSLARVNVTGLADPSESITRDPGGSVRTLAGIRALLDAGIRVQLDAAILRPTIEHLSELPEILQSALGDLGAIESLQLRVPVDVPDPSLLVSYEAAARAIASLEDRARRRTLQLRVAPDSGPPPCVFSHQARVSHLFSMTPGATRRQDSVQVEACSTCQMNDRCSGLPKTYLQRFPVPKMVPIQEDRLRRRLSLVGSIEDQVAREFVTVNRRESPEGLEIEKVIRINFHCNQSCRFCFVSTHLPSLSEERVRDAIRQAGAEGVDIALSGGEPTLNPNLLEYVRLARASGGRRITLQTNATRIDSLEFVKELEKADLDAAFVSLHGSTAEISDAITEAPGTFEKTLVGLDLLAQIDIFLIINFVICQRNMHDLVPFVRLVGARWPGAYVNISFVAPSSDVVPKEAALIPRYSEALPEIALAVAEAKRLGLDVHGFESMCGLPLCLVPMELQRYLDFSIIPEGFDGGEFVKAEACRGCALEQKCYGIRRGYRDLHGETELRRIQVSP